MKKSPILSKYDAGVKVCPGNRAQWLIGKGMICARIVYNATRVCPGCGYEFYLSKAKNNETAMASDVPINFGELR